MNKKCLRHSMNSIHKQELMKSTKFDYLALTTKYISRIMDMMV